MMIVIRKTDDLFISYIIFYGFPQSPEGGLWLYTARVYILHIHITHIYIVHILQLHVYYMRIHITYVYEYYYVAIGVFI